MFFFFNDTATTEIYTLSYTTLFRSPSNAHNVARGPRSRIVGKDHSRARIHIPRTGIAGAILHHVRTACKGLSSAPRASSRSCPAPSEARSSAQRRRWQQHLQWADVE